MTDQPPDDVPAPAPEPPRPRGRHKVYVGAAAGVGKTYRALGEIRERRAAGVDALVGFLETHGRAETQAAAEGLPVFPRKMVEYKGVRLGEVDVEGLVRRRPDLVLVDELAHTNAPGSRHPKRFLDVEDLLAAGVNVVSTMNIQHLESLNDLVARTTGVRVRERVPDRIVLEADEVVLVDVSPEGLQERLRAGKIYPPDKIDQSLSSFFTLENLSSLRELALRQVADAVEEPPQPEEALGRGVKERIAVAISAVPEAGRLVRRGARVAQRLSGDLLVVHVWRRQPTPDKARVLADLEELTASLQGEFHAVEGGDVAEALISFVRAQDATQVILGETRRSRLAELLRGSIIHEVLRRTHGVDVYVIAEGG